jgi:hypothetical protein
MKKSEIPEVNPRGDRFGEDHFLHFKVVIMACNKVNI